MRALRTYVKICGLTRPEDAVAALAAGADALGVVFADSPRKVSATRALAIFEGVDEGVPRVGVFADQHIATVENIALRIKADWVQLSGDEPPEYCSALPIPVVKAIGTAGKGELKADVQAYTGPASGFLLDSRAGGAAGGTGLSFDWKALAPLPVGHRFMVAGGLTAENVGEAMRALRPWAVDVSSGVESSPGVKDAGLMEAFVAAVRAADEALAGG